MKKYCKTLIALTLLFVFISSSASFAARIKDIAELTGVRNNQLIIKNLKNNALMTYTLVPESEADLKSGKISVSSPHCKRPAGEKGR